MTRAVVRKKPNELFGQPSISHILPKRWGHREVGFSKATALGGRENGAGNGEQGVREETQKGSLLRLWEGGAKSLSQMLVLGLQVGSGHHPAREAAAIQPGRRLGNEEDVWCLTPSSWDSASVKPLEVPQ